MIIKTLIENTSTTNDLACEHGLSLYIETKHHKILFDTGASGLFAANAEKLKVDLGAIDIAVISHGHYDHGGGLKTFLGLNDRAKIYLSSHAFDQHYANRADGGVKYIGLDETLLPNPRFVFVGDTLKIDNELALLSGVKCQRLNPTGNVDLLKQDGTAYACDDFIHEQNLVIRDGEKNVLLAGCAHCGIVNILEHLYRTFHITPDVVISGFHLYNPARNENESPDIVAEIAQYLIKKPTAYYTCHCTGLESYGRLKSIMGDTIDYLSSGRTLEI